MVRSSQPVSQLGRMMPKHSVSGKEILVAMKAYLDGSGYRGKGKNKQSSDFLVLTGVAATDAAWGSFDEDWRKILANREPKAPYVHMRELVPLAKPFLAELGWDEHKADRLVTNCLMYAQHLDKKKFRTFTCTVDLEAYNAIIARGDKLPSPYSLCAYYSPEKIF